MSAINSCKKKIRFPISGILVFSFLLLGCSGGKKDDGAVTIQWNGRKAESIIIPRSLLASIPDDSIGKFLQIQLINSKTQILGDFDITDEKIVFRPLIAFTRGLKYEVWLKDKMLSQLDIPMDNTISAPAVVSIYPTGNVIPENLLKIHIEFSKPMQEGQARRHITVIRNRIDTIPSIFLDLEQELWNKERTLLTLWLDPGRIKRGLQPNENIGPPLEKGLAYRILVIPGWRDAEGAELTTSFQKDFVVGERDNVSPDPGTWTLHPPAAGTTQPLKIELHESLDQVLLRNTIRILDDKGHIINGAIHTETTETILYFTPIVSWNAREYTMEIESRLEDLAGNNLERLFDKDITVEKAKEKKEVYIRSFHIQ